MNTPVEAAYSKHNCTLWRNFVYNWLLQQQSQRGTPAAREIPQQ